MKYQFIIGLFLTILFLYSCNSTRSLPAESAFVQEKTDSRDFFLTANYADPKKGSWKALMPDYYSLILRNDSVIADLPYYGKIKSSTLLNRQGHLNFAELIEDYTVESNRKKTKWKIKFKANTPEEELNLFLKIKQDGSCKFTINSEKRDSIVYKGYLK